MARKIFGFCALNACKSESFVIFGRYTQTCLTLLYFTFVYYCLMLISFSFRPISFTNFFSKVAIGAAFLSLCFTACDAPPLDIDQEQQIKLAAAADSILLVDFNQNIQRLQQTTANNVSVLPLAEQIARLPQPMQQAIFVTNPDSADLIALPKMDSSAPTEIWVENAAMLIAIRDYKAARDKVLTLVAQNDGLVAAEAERFTEQKLQNTFTIQVPVANYPILLNAFRDMAMVLREKTTWREDLSVSWTDVQARLEAKRVAQQRLKTMLQAAKSTEILAVQRELDILYEEMQTLNRTAQLLRQKTRYSTITLAMYQDASQPATAQANFGERISENAQNGWAHFKTTLIKLSTYWVYISIGSLFLLVMYFSARRARSRAAAEQKQLFAAQQQQWQNNARKN